MLQTLSHPSLPAKHQQALACGSSTCVIASALFIFDLPPVSLMGDWCAADFSSFCTLLCLHHPALLRMQQNQHLVVGCKHQRLVVVFLCTS